MRDQMEKRLYTTPNVVRVKLTHEQAVLSQCSVGTTSLSNLGGLWCGTVASGKNCRKSGGVGNTDSQSTS